jgi:crotonobetainyl-CoA:carnitine CoA-transferase CaiB-like acyl-CoA transferase
MGLPLDGIKIIDFTRVQAGPAPTQLLRGSAPLC